MNRLLGTILIFTMLTSFSGILILPGSATAVYKLPDSGQFGDFSINPMSYTNNDDGTVTDNNTGLMWQKCSVGQNNDSTCSGTASMAYNWYQATGTYHASYNPSSQNICGSLNFGGHNDWRLPLKNELITIVNYSIVSPGPAINTSYFPNTKPAGYWTATEGGYYANGAWYIIFRDGADNAVPEYGDFYIRCVRPVQSNQSFTDNLNGTVTENKTGLVWQQDEGGNKTWYDALSYCNNLVLPTANGQTDWRLPNVKELESLTDDSRSSPKINTDYFPSTHAAYYWSSTTYGGSPQAWYVPFSGGYVSINSNDKTDSTPFVRCVRGGNAGSNIRLMRGGSLVNGFAILGDAYSAAADGDVIQAQEMGFPETLTFANNTVFSLQGGYNADFVLNPGMTTLQGSLTISRGTVNVENLILK